MAPKSQKLHSGTGWCCLSNS